MSLSTYQPGQSARFTVTAEALGVPAASLSQLTLTITGPDGTALTGTVVNDGGGAYHADVMLPDPARVGKWRVTWRSPGNTPSTYSKVEYWIQIQTISA